MEFVLIFTLAFLAACAKKDQAPAPAPPGTPSPSPISGTFCGDYLVSVDGECFKIDPNNPANASMVSDGTYGWDEYTNGWGQVIPACHYQVKNGIPTQL